MHRLSLAFYGLVAIFFLAMIYQFVQNGQNGRYQFKDGERPMFLDTRTGTVYVPDTATNAYRTFYTSSNGQSIPIDSRMPIWGNKPLIFSKPVE